MSPRYIKIPAKNAAPSNKPQTHPEKPELPKPFIDKISINILVPKSTGGSEHVGKDIYEAVFTSLDDAELFSKGSVKNFGNFKLGKRIVLDSVNKEKHFPVFHAAYDKVVGVSRLRLEFVPVDLGPDGIEELKIAVNTFLPDGWAFVLDHGVVSRLDVTVDIPHLSMNAFYFLPQQATATMQYKQKGDLQSVYFGSNQGNQTVVYDRKAKRLQQNSSWNGPQTVRVERRLKNTQKKLSQLQDLQNPFAGMKLIENVQLPPASMPPSKHYMWTLFLDSVKVRGLTDALALLPQEQRALYRKHLIANPKSVWDPETIWGGWKSMLDELKITEASL